VIAVPAEDPRVRHVADLPKRVRSEFEEFFITASRMSDKKVKIKGWKGPGPARKAILAAAERYIRRGSP
jgi:inorganic pyrophosphatase